jgi:hypothetical protein
MASFRTHYDNLKVTRTAPASVIKAAYKALYPLAIDRLFMRIFFTVVTFISFPFQAYAYDISNDISYSGDGGALPGLIYVFTILFIVSRNEDLFNPFIELLTPPGTIIFLLVSSLFVSMMFDDNSKHLVSVIIVLILSIPAYYFLLSSYKQWKLRKLSKQNIYDNTDSNHWLLTLSGYLIVSLFIFFPIFLIFKALVSDNFARNIWYLIYIPSLLLLTFLRRNKNPDWDKWMKRIAVFAVLLVVFVTIWKFSRLVDLNKAATPSSYLQPQNTPNYFDKYVTPIQPENTPNYFDKYNSHKNLDLKGIKIKNNCNEPITLSILYFSESGWTTEGWWIVNSSDQILIGRTTAYNTIYIYANSPNYSWKGDTNNSKDISKLISSDMFIYLDTAPTVRSQKNSIVSFKEILANFNGDSYQIDLTCPKISESDKDVAQLANDLYKKGRYTEALPFYTQMAEQGDANAQYILGQMYLNGLGVVISDSLAAYWNNKAAEKGHAEARNTIKALTPQTTTKKTKAQVRQQKQDRLAVDEQTRLETQFQLEVQAKMPSEAQDRLATQRQIQESAQKLAHKLGNTLPDGGIVFYVDSSGSHGLEVKAADEFDLLNWEDAIDAASNYGSGWRLPTSDELQLLYEQKSNIGGFAAGNYWSSSSSENRTVVRQNFSDGVTQYQPIADELSVRAVRSF